MKKLNLRFATTSALIALAFQPGLSSAQDLSLSGNVGTQSVFRALSDDLGAALSYKGQTPAEPLGILGFDIGIAATSTKLVNTSKYANALDGNASLILPSVRAYKGLPFDIDVGASYTAAGDVKLVGAELRYALLSGGVLTPAVSLRGSMSKLSGVDELEFSTKGVDLSVSKGFAFATPYAGIGRVWVDSTPKITGLTLNKEAFSMNKYYVGLGLNMLLLNLNLEADKTGEATSYSAKLGIRF